MRCMLLSIIIIFLLLLLFCTMFWLFSFCSYLPFLSEHYSSIKYNYINYLIYHQNDAYVHQLSLTLIIKTEWLSNTSLRVMRNWAANLFYLMDFDPKWFILSRINVQIDKLTIFQRCVTSIQSKRMKRNKITQRTKE